MTINWRSIAVSATLAVAAATTWVSYAATVQETEIVPARSIEAMMAELDDAHDTATMCRKMLDKPLRCLP